MANAEAHAEAHKEGQQHPLGIYFKIWGLRFVLSPFSYLVAFLVFHGCLRWTLILMFMFMKAGLIVAVFMHMMWERLALVFAIALPIIALMVFVFLMTNEADNTFLSRGIYFLGLGGGS